VNSICISWTHRRLYLQLELHNGLSLRFSLHDSVNTPLDALADFMRHPCVPLPMVLPGETRARGRPGVAQERHRLASKNVSGGRRIGITWVKRRKNRRIRHTRVN